LEALALVLAAPALAGEFPAGQSYVIELENSVAVSGLGEYFVPPLKEAFDAAGLIYEPGPSAVWVATIRNFSDTGAWVAADGGEEWLYERRILIGLSPAGDLPPGGVTADPAFGAEIVLLTPDADRVDELDCLVRTAVRTLVPLYEPEGRLTLDGSGCRRE
jgi:hypothetical protein